MSSKFYVEMKLYCLFFAFFIGITCNYAHSQISDEITKLQYEIATRDLIKKAEDINDPQIKGILAQQALRFAKRFDFEKSLWGPLMTLSYESSKSLQREAFYQKNPELTREQANEQSDLAFNQYKIQLNSKNPKNLPNAMRSVHLTSNGKHMYSSMGNGSILTWDVQSKTHITQQIDKHINRIVAISHDERYMAVATNENSIYLVRIPTMERVNKLAANHLGPIVDLVFLPDNTGYITVGIDRQIIYTDFESSTLLTDISISPTDLSISPDGKLLAVGSRSGKLLLLDLSSESGEPLEIEHRNINVSIERIEFGPTGQMLALGGSDIYSGQGFVSLYDLKKSTPIGPKLEGFDAGITAITFSGKGNMVAASSRDNSARIWQIENNTCYYLPLILDDHQDWVWSLDFSPEDDAIFTASADGMIRRFDLNIESYDQLLSNQIIRNLTESEWESYIGDIELFPWEATCSSEDNND
jgi:WD40 repeat protein